MSALLGKQFSRFRIVISLIIPSNAFETDEFWCIVGLTAILRLLQRETFFNL